MLKEHKHNKNHHNQIYSQENEHIHDHSHNHEHDHNSFHANPDEIPAVFSYSVEIKFKNDIEEDKFISSLKLWMENLRDWSINNKYLTGHLKSFVEIDESRSIWIACTGKDINIKATGNKNNKVSNFKINMTLIIFGPDESVLRKTAIRFLKDNLPGIDIN